MKRLESWLVFIDAKHMASDLASDLHDAFGLLPSFPESGNSFATFAFSFAQDDWSSRTAIAILRSRDVSRCSCSRTTGCPKAALHESPRSQGRHEEPALDRIVRSGRPHRIEEPADLELEAVGIARQRLRCSKYLRGRRAGFAGAALHVANVGGHLLRSHRGLLHVARDFLCRGTLLFHSRCDGRGDL